MQYAVFAYPKNGSKMDWTRNELLGLRKDTSYQLVAVEVNSWYTDITIKMPSSGELADCLNSVCFNFYTQNGDPFDPTYFTDRMGRGEEADFDGVHYTRNY